jgi:hypothetical protein
LALRPCRECRREVSTEANQCPHCGVSNPSGRRTPGQILLLTLFGLFLISYLPSMCLVSTGSGPGRSSSETGPRASTEYRDPYVDATGRLYTGVQLYYGPNKMYVGEILGGNNHYVSPSGLSFRGVKLRMRDGSEEWKDRDAIIRGKWYVRRDDPAITRGEWYEYRQQARRCAPHACRRTGNYSWEAPCPKCPSQFTASRSRARRAVKGPPAVERGVMEHPRRTPPLRL